MPSTAYREWATTRARALDEVESAHVAVGGTGPGRRTATQQINQAYAVLLASQFQGFCRDLHTECVDRLITTIGPPPRLLPVVRDEFFRGRQLDRGNARPGSIGSDFGRLDVDFWPKVLAIDPRNPGRRALLESLNDWRNAIAHQDFRSVSPGTAPRLGLSQVRRWRRACRGLAIAFDEVMRAHLQVLIGSSPW